MRKKIIVPTILLLLLAGILLITLGIHHQSSPDSASAPSVSTGTASSATAATTAQQTEEPTPSSTIQQTKPPFEPIHYTVDKSKPVKATENNKLKLTDKKAKIQSDADDDYPLYIIQKDGSVDKYPDGADDIESLYQAPKWLYYTLDDSHADTTTLYRAPIRQQGGKTVVQMKKQERLKKLDISQFIYGTDQYVICTMDDDLIKYNIKSKKSQRIDSDSAQDEKLDILWDPICDLNQNPIISKNGDLYFIKQISDEDDKYSIAFCKVNVDTFRMTKLSDRTNDVLLDSSRRIVIMEADKKWNYAYYPETGKRIRCGRNMMNELGADDALNDFNSREDYDDEEDYDEEDYDEEDYDDEEDEEDDLNGFRYCIDSKTRALLYLPFAANRDLIGWIREKNPWSYQEKKGHFSCMNYFVYNDRMYVKVTFSWVDAEENERDEGGDYGGEFANMLFSYSLKNYKGIRPETELNRIMQKYSSRTEEWVEDSSYYSYTVTGDFSFLFKDILVFEYDDFYVLYHLGTGAYRKIEGKNKDSLYLKRLYEELYEE